MRKVNIEFFLHTTAEYLRISHVSLENASSARCKIMYFLEKEKFQCKQRRRRRRKGRKYFYGQKARTWRPLNGGSGPRKLVKSEPSLAVATDWSLRPIDAPRVLSYFPFELNALEKPPGPDMIESEKVGLKSGNG